MDTGVKQFIKFFQDFIDICQLEYWPNNDTSEIEIKHAFLMSQHIEKCLDKLQNRGILSEFLSLLSNYDNACNSIKKECLMDPPKYVLKKVINSNAVINQIDIGMKQFVELFSEDKLETCLAQLMVEAASKELLLQHISKDKLLKFKSDLLLHKIISCNADFLRDLIQNGNQTVIELLVVIIVHKDIKHAPTVKLIVNELFSAISSRKPKVYKKFWQLFFKVDTKYFNEMCLSYPDMFTKILEALIDNQINLREGMSLDCFYIELSKSELEDTVRKICSNSTLKSEFLAMQQCSEFFQSMLTNS